MTQQAQVLAQDLFDKAVNPIMDLPLSDDTIISIGLELACIMLDEIANRNTDQSKHDLYYDTHRILMEMDVVY